MAKKVITEIIENGQEYGWYEETSKIGRSYNIDIEEAKVEWKKKIKTNIKEKLKMKANEREEQMKKLRHKKMKN